MTRWGTWVVLAAVCLAPRAILAREVPAPGTANGADMDYGAFLTGSLDLDPLVSARHATAHSR